MIYVLLTTQLHTFLSDKKILSRFDIKNCQCKYHRFGTTNLVEGSKRVNIMLQNETIFQINDVLYSSKSTRYLINFKDLRRNKYHIETMKEGNTKCLYITLIASNKNLIVEKLSAIFSRLYQATIKPIESYVVMNLEFNNPKTKRSLA